MNRAFLTFLAFLAIIATGHAATNFVTTTGAGDGSGSSWANASLLTNALSVVSDGAEIWIAEGTYTDTNQFEVQANNVTLYGGFTIGMTSLATRDWVANPVLLDGQGLRRVMVISNNVTLDGLVITNGNASGGAGLYMRGMHTVAVHNCHVVDNRISSGTAEGPGAYFYNGSVIISNTVFAGNKSQPPASHNNGQGFYAYNVALEIRDCIFTNNGPVPGSATYAIRCASGGAAYIDQGSLLVEDSVFVDNVSPSDCSGSAGGGAMFIRNCPSEIRRCVFTRNIVNEYVNYAAEHGGALWLNVGSGAATIEHCIFDRNRTGTHTGRLGGGVYVGGGNVTISNCTFSGNSTSGEGGAIAVNGGALTLVNTILYTNAAAVRANDIVVKAGSATVSYCRLDGTEDLVNIYDPLGGLTLSRVATNDPLFADAAGGDFHLQSPSGRWDSGLQAFVTSDSAPHSSCIDSGDPAHDASSEVVANGNRINMGRYGGTAQASRSPGNAPIIQNGPAVVTGNVAVVDGVLINNDTIADVAFYYDTNPGITGADMSVALFPPQQTGTLFQADLAGLAYATTYYYRWYATNGYGHNFAAAESSFTTGAKSAGGPDGVIHVKPGSTGGQTGDNWFNAFGSVADAMAAVDDATNEVWVAAGTYDDATVEIDRACDIFGGFSGTETNRSQRDIQANPTILDGVGLRRIMSITSNAVLDGLIISNGNWTSGAGIYKTGDNTLAIRNCRIVSNRCTGGPGIGARLVSGTVTISNTVFAFNYGQADGQGLYANGVDLTVQYCTFTNNGPEPGLPAYVVRCRSGGGMFIQGGSLDVTDSLFIDNVSPSDCGAENGGGAIHIKSASSVLISGTDFVRNTVAEHGTYNNKNGGALWIDVGTSTARVDHCTFINNLTGTGPQDDGGALYLENGYLTVSNCTFSGNRCSTEGGAIAVSGGNLFLVNSILYTNSAGVQASDIALTGGTITGTWCRLDGTTPSNHVYDAVGGLTLLNIITDDPLFVGGTDVHLKSRGGHWDTATQTFVKDSVTSPCIDAGDPTSGYSREPVPNGRRINLGAYGNTPEASWQPNTGFILEIR